MQTIRKVTLEDAGAILEIYNYYILNSIVTFDEKEKTLEEISTKIKDTLKKYPWFVLEENGELIAFTYASQWKDKSAYDKSVEGTIYIRNKHEGKRIGTTLYTYLINYLQSNGYHSILGVISLPNEASVALHKKLGFDKVAHFKEIGLKFNKKIDVGCWQLIL